MKGLSQVLGLTFVQKYSQLKPETWLRPFVNTAPGFCPLGYYLFYGHSHLNLNRHPKVKYYQHQNLTSNISDYMISYDLMSHHIFISNVQGFFKYGHPSLTLNDVAKVKSDHIKTFPADNFL